MFESFEKLPMIALRGLSVFPGMILNFDIERPISIAALDRAMEADRRIFLLAQRDADVEEPAAEDLYAVGCIASIRQILRMPNGGVRVLVEGKTEGNLVHPWLLAGVTNDMPVARNEVFGPICSIMSAKSEEEAIAIVNDTEYGLSNSVMGRDRYHATEIAARLESGMVHVNDQTIGEEFHVMFGAEKQSGVGRFNGKWVLEKFTTEQWISVR